MLDAGQFVVRSLLDERQITPVDHDRAVSHASSHGIDLTHALIDLEIIDTRQLAIARARICEYPFVDLAAFEVDIKNAGLLPKQAAERLMAFPLFLIDGVATVAMEDPLNLAAIDQINQRIKAQVDPVLCDVQQLDALITRAYSLTRTNDIDGSGPKEEELTTGDEPLVAAVNQILVAAIDDGASDVHISPDEHHLHLRYRVDGVLRQQQGPPLPVHPGLVQRLKVMARLDLTQTRRPQDGKFRFAHRGQTIDVRLSLLPTVYGENVVMRLLRPAGAIGSVSELGMPEAMTEEFGRLIEKPHGIILVTGPTGSGKTTTLYTALARINEPQRNIMTIEDPVEIRLPMIRQIQANPEVGLTFASALRSILRQDPDVILVGEIRDDETAKIAVQAALTGHLVFSTLHTNDAIGSIARLRDFGVPSFAINNALLAVIAQRLLRMVCSSCAAPYTPSPAELSGLGLAPGAEGFVRAPGCASCMNTGYRGRFGVYEMLRVTPSVQALIEAEATAREIGRAARAEGMRSLLEDGIQKAHHGRTTIKELAKLNATLRVDNGQQRGMAA